MRKLFYCLISLLYCTVAQSETMYMSFLSKPGSVLTKSNISLRIDKKDIAITEFFQVDAAARDQTILSHPSGRRHYVLLIDFLNVSPAQAPQLRKLAQDFVASVPKDDLIALAAITNEEGLRFFSGFTGDRSKLIAGWNLMGKPVLSGWVEGPEGNLYSSKISNEAPPLELLGDEEFVANLKSYAIDAKLKDEFAPLYIQAFVELSSLLSTIKGRKNVVLFSPGMDVKGLRVDLEEMKKEEPKKEETEEGSPEEQKTFREMAQPGVRDLEALAAAGPKTKQAREADAGIVPKLIEGADGHVHVLSTSPDQNGFLKNLAEKTHGSYRNLQDFGSSIAQILSADQTYYVVGWEGQQEKTFHELHDVQIRAGDSEIQAPARWLAPKPVTDYSPLEKKAHIAQAIYKTFHESDQYRFWSDVILDEGINRISCFTEVHGSELLSGKSKELHMEFYGFTIAPDGTIIDFYHVPISMDLMNAKLTERLQKAGLKIWNVMFAGRGPMTIRTVAFNTQTGETISNSNKLFFKDSEFLLSNPFFPSVNFDWVIWPKLEQAQNRRGSEILYPYRVGADIFVPELDPKIHPAEKGKILYFKMYNFIPGNQYPSVRLRMLGEDGTSVEIDKFGLMQQPRLIQRGGLELFWTIETMPSLTKGKYKLQVDVIDRKQNKEVIRDVLTAVE